MDKTYEAVEIQQGENYKVAEKECLRNSEHVYPSSLDLDPGNLVIQIQTRPQMLGFGPSLTGGP